MNEGEIRTVLLVEDNADHADILEGVIGEALPAAALEWVDHGTRAYERLVLLAQAGGLPDLVLLDLKLPGYGGIEVLRLCRAQDALRDVRILVLTSSNAQEERRAASDAGADGYLVKTFPLSGLADRLTQAIGAL